MVVMRHSDPSAQASTPPLLPIPASADQAKTNRIAEIVRIIFLGILMISCSAGVISFNKYLMAGPFPFALHLVLGHMGFGSCFAAVLYITVPSFFPSLTDTDKKFHFDRWIVFTRVFPIAVFFAGSLVLSNMSYLYLSVAFLQILKETNVVLVYLLSIVVGLDLLRWRSLGLLLFITAGTTLTVYGEMHFLLIGVLIQISSQLFEVCRLVLQSMLLTGKGLKLDVMSYNLLVMPLCFFSLGFLLLATSIFGHGSGGPWGTPQLSDYVGNSNLLVANALLAFFLNVSMALFIKYSSATSTTLAQILKDVAIVLSAVVFTSEVLMPLQVLGFTIQIIGVFSWSMMRTFPEKFEHGIVSGLLALMRDAIGCEASPPLDTAVAKETQNSSCYGAAPSTTSAADRGNTSAAALGTADGATPGAAATA